MSASIGFAAPFDVKATDLAGRICSLRTKTSVIETPALLPVIHPVRQLVPCSEIRGMGYEAVMTNAYTTYRRLKERAESEGIHKVIGFDGTVMTDSGGYQVLEFGEVGVGPKDISDFEQTIGTDIAIILDKPTGLDVTKEYARHTVEETLKVARATRQWINRDDILWTLPIQGGRYIDLVSKSAKESANLGYGCFALGSPVEVMEDYDFPLLVRMIVAAKSRLPPDRPFHLFGAGHPLVIPLAVALGCDMFDSASYMLYARENRYIASTGTIRLEQLEYLGCNCGVCASMKARELRSLSKDERTIALARHNLYALKKMIEETKQAIWEGRLWEYVQTNSRNHPRAFEAFKTAVELSASIFENGTPLFKDKGIFISEALDLKRPEVARYSQKVEQIDLSKKEFLVVVPEPKSKPFLMSRLCSQIGKLVPLDKTLITHISANFGLIPAEISDVFPLSQTTSILEQFPSNDAILHRKIWKTINILLKEDNFREKKWFLKEKEKLSKKTRVTVSTSYSDFKKKLTKLEEI